ncbi:MAG: ATP-NAD kinase family protein [Thermoplasmata archaeon]|nr:ATP-NAD kinase family protein [Thermoplasmata archaeon]
MRTIGLVVNPIAGMGGRVGLKGTDGVLEKALELGGRPVAPEKMSKFLDALSSLLKSENVEGIEWLTCGESMGASYLEEFGEGPWEWEVVFQPGDPTAAEDTKAACSVFSERDPGLIVFCGGDGTARDIWKVVGNEIPIIGIPSGVKMHSGVFGMNPEAVAFIVLRFLLGELDVADGEILDLDEERYRAGEWHIRLFGIASTPNEPSYVQVGKMHAEAVPEEEMKTEIAEHVAEDMDENRDTLYILGSGSTVAAISKEIGVDCSLLGVDAVYRGELLEKDLNEDQLLSLLDQYEKVKLIITPIGAQGFILGRGNLQLSPSVIKRVGLNDIVIICTPGKLRRTPFLRVDTGDDDLDQEFRSREYLTVVTGYRTMKLWKIAQ